MASIQLFERLVEVVRDTSRNIHGMSNNDIHYWLDMCNSTIKELNEKINKSNLSRGEKQKYQTCMTHLSCVQVQLEQHLQQGGSLQSEETEARVEWRDVESAFQNRIRTGVVVNIKHVDILSFFNDAQKLFKVKVEDCLKEYNAVKINSDFIAEFSMQKNGEETTDIKYFTSESVTAFMSTNLEEWFKDHIKEPILTQLEEFQEKDSGWTLTSIISLCINMKKYSPIKGSSFIPLPKFIEKKKACVNIRNNDNQCFKYAILSALHPSETNPNRVNQYRMYENELNFGDIEFPVKLKDVPKFEKLNDISVNVYMLKKYNVKFEVSPCHITKEKKEKHVNLLLIQDFYIDENEENNHDVGGSLPKYHYVWIKYLSRILSSQLSKSHVKSYHCERCLQIFYCKERLQMHENYCKNINKCRINLPDFKNNILKFEDYNKSEKVPFVIYADFECLLKPTENENAFQLHEAYSIGYYIKCSFDDSLSVYKSYRQKNEDEETPAKWFVRELKGISEKIDLLYKNPKPMRLTDLEELSFRGSTVCHICRKPIKNDELAVRDHCHLTGRFRGAAHNSCNLNYKDSRFVPVIFHNLNYDTHFILKEIATSTIMTGRVSLIPHNKEKYISFTKFIDDCDISFRFIDSWRFLPSSLEKLASYLETVPIAVNEFKTDGFTDEQINLLRRKGVFPYDFVDGLDKLMTTKLPEKNEFYNKLTDSHIIDEDYHHAVTVWNMFTIRTLGEYSDLYLKTDVLLLADVFESFRETSLKAYSLCPTHFYTTPGLTFSAALKMTKVELELLTDIDMLMFIEAGIRGGISQCCNRYAKANNPYMGSSYDKNQKTKTLLYFDINNLYGWAMVQYLPVGKFKWIEYETNSNFFNAPPDSDTGYFAEVDLEYPEEIHDDHQDLPFCAEHRTPPGSKQKKLLTTLNDKKRYVIHYLALKQVLDNGLRLKKVHRILSFEQKPWLKPYVEFNTEKRKQAKNEFEKLFYKLLINAVYGKCIERERSRVDVRLVNKFTGRYGAEARIAQPNFHSCAIFDENLVAIQLKRTSITIKKPIYVGLSILDMSKTLLYDFHYSYMKRRLGEKCKLLYTDTDSLIYEVDDVDMYKIMKEDLHKFDTSDYKENNQFGIPRVNKKVPGLMKDECNGKIMTEFIGLRSKMYSILIDGSETVKKAKGIKSSVVKKTITFEDYRKCLEEQIIVKREQCNIRSKLHIVHTEKQNKIALSPHDDKRYLLPHSTDTLPWGHYRIIEEQMALAVSQMEEDEKMADTRGERVGEMELEKGYEATNTKEESERAMERGSELSNENSAARVGMTLYGDTGEQIFIEYDVCEELMHEWNPSMEGASSNRRDILQEAMEGADIVVGNGLYEPTHHGEEHIRAVELENYLPLEKKPRLT
ncbi:uncharacterized protein LOC107981297 [Nasonia vitripennis]|uniref:DNA-directed DNA polymerase n=1 Tax=Nasonia vitripennis TaxID=7425 RepID=A0A7M7PVU3_NASVI|nr:uncharacterized protein LOC107981297 [Nasonia vitripennis]